MKERSGSPGFTGAFLCLGLMSPLLFDAVGKIHAAVFEGFAFDDLEVDLAAHGMEERNAGAEEDWLDGEADLVDKTGFEEGAGQVAAAHEVDVFAFALPELADEAGSVFVHESKCWFRGVQRSREDEVLLSGKARFLAVPEGQFVGFAAPEDGVDPLPEAEHERCGFVILADPVNGLVETGEVVVEAIGSAEDDLSHGLPPVSRDVAASVFRLRRAGE